MSETPRQVFEALFDEEYDAEGIASAAERAADRARWLARYDEAQIQASLSVAVASRWLFPMPPGSSAGITGRVEQTYKGKPIATLSPEELEEYHLAGEFLEWLSNSGAK